MGFPGWGCSVGPTGLSAHHHSAGGEAAAETQKAANSQGCPHPSFLFFSARIWQLPTPVLRGGMASLRGEPEGLQIIPNGAAPHRPFLTLLSISQGFDFCLDFTIAW